MHVPGKSFVVSSGSDVRYHKCYEVPICRAPVHFSNWLCAKNTDKFDGQHLVDNIWRLAPSCELVTVVPSCVDAHQRLYDTLLDEERNSVFGSVFPGVLRSAMNDSSRMRALEKKCGITMEEIGKPEEEALWTMAN